MTNTAAQPSADDWNRVVAANIRAELARKGWSHAQAATALGTNEMWVSRRLSLNGNGKFNADDIVAFAAVVGVPVGDLFNARKAPTPEGGGRSLPEVDSNHQPAGYMPGRLATVTRLTPRGLDAADRGVRAAVHALRSA